MAGNPSNVRLFTEADVFVYKQPVLAPADIPDDITDPFDTTVAWDATAQSTVKWGYLGILVGADGIDTQREFSETDITGWGYGTILVASKDFKATVALKAREDNPVVQSIKWPGSSDTTLVIPDPAHLYFGFEKRTADGYIDRKITKRPARLWIPNEKDVEGDNTPSDLTARIFPNSARELFIWQHGDAA
ncbi:hypothetical protein [Mycolicibacterium komossense]|uniref:Major tail protein n=1 Tax=Mycolicibacterium komossense TaxID=1779 RepID=A0ABT3CMR3_9MYCO|nr:hypothetical protein [Mycolicibacterium komossense]MCV7230667.1 hypothetical protein [Mycolicibacterium komossense]